MELRRIDRADVSVVMGAGHLFDHAPTPSLVEHFLQREGHHLVIAFVDDLPAGFVSGIEVSHPDRRTEMMLYELGVDEPFRRRGVGRALVEALVELAGQRGCSGVWVPVEADDERAMTFYRSVGHPQQESAEIFWWDAQPPPRGGQAPA